MFWSALLWVEFITTMKLHINIIFEMFSSLRYRWDYYIVRKQFVLVDDEIMKQLYYEKAMF